MNTIFKEGVVKYDLRGHQSSNPLSLEDYMELERWRAILYKKKLIGEYPIEKVGYGNLSSKKSEYMVITGSQTGSLAVLDGRHYVRVYECDLQNSKISSSGPITPSSESLSHWAIYNADSNIKFVFHIHSKEMWKRMLELNYSKTPVDVPYGSKELADSLVKCVQSGKTHVGILVTEGHEDGIFAYGEDIDQVGELILDTYNKIV